MSAFIVGHAAHPDWRNALARAAEQIESRRAGAVAPTLGLAYFTDHHAGAAAEMLVELQRRWPGVAWVGTVGVGVAAGGVEYFDEPALVLMLAALPAESFEIFSGQHRLERLHPAAALVHADPRTPELGELLADLSERTTQGYLFGGLSSSRGPLLQIAGGVLQGGLSGVAFASTVGLLSRVTQGCQPVGPVRRVTAAERNVVLELDGRPALQALLADLGLAGVGELRQAVARLRATLVGLTDAQVGVAQVGVSPRRGNFGIDTKVRHLIGIDPARQALAVGDLVTPGMSLAFCQRDVQAARRDLVRICSEIREEVEQRNEAAAAAGDAPAALPLSAPDGAPAMRGALYVSCAGRGGPHFGAPSAELQIVRHALGDVPLVGFFAAGEIAHRHLYGYTGVLTVFTGP